MPFESPQENESEKLEREIAELEASIEKQKDVLKRHDATMQEYKEVWTIIEGLNKKVDSLVEEDKKLSKNVPDSEEEWTAWQERGFRILGLRSKIADLYDEAEGLMGKMDKIQEDFNNG